MLDETTQNEIIARGRRFMRGYMEEDYSVGFESDQMLKKPQPPLAKEPLTPLEEHIALTRDFAPLKSYVSIDEILRDRRSVREFDPSGDAISLDELSFLLWATQGVKAIRGDNYATIRTVPCGGARHEFETYLAVREIDGLAPGIYHYLPLEHALEFMYAPENIEREINSALCEQSWAKKASVVFFWAIDCYRVEWRYGIRAHRPALIDVGHIGENLYIACSSLGLGNCTIAAFDDAVCTRLFRLDGENEFVVYCSPVGVPKESRQFPYFLGER